MIKISLILSLVAFTGCTTLDDALFICNKQCNTTNRVVDNVTVDSTSLVCSCKKRICEDN